MTDPYCQHHPGIAAVGAAIKNELAVYDAKRVVRLPGDGNFVFFATDILYKDKPAANYDLFRLENGKVFEHWDLYELIAPTSEWMNRNGKF